MEENEKRLKEKRKEVEEGWTTAIAGLCCQSKLFREDLKAQSTKQLQKALMHTHSLTDMYICWASSILI